MPQWRKLQTKILESDDFNELPDDFCRLVWALLPLVLDRHGRSKDLPAYLVSRVFPMREDVTTGQMAEALDAFEARGMIERYEADGRRYFWAPKFPEYQGNTSREAPSVLPAPPSWVESESRAGRELVVSESGTDVDADVEAEADSDAEQIPPPPGAGGPVREAFVEAFGVEPEPATLARLEKCPDLGLLREVMAEWARKRHNPQNVDGLAEQYLRAKWARERESKASKGRNGRNGRDEPTAEDFKRAAKGNPTAEEIGARVAAKARADPVADAWEKAYMHIQAYIPGLRRPLEGAEAIGISEDGERVKVRPAEECRVLFGIRPGLVANARTAGVEVVLDE